MNKDYKFIKEAYNGQLGLTVCQNWKDKILDDFPIYGEITIKFNIDRPLI